MAGRVSRRRRRGASSPDFSSPTPASPPRAAVLRISGEAEGSIRPEFDWAGEIAKAVGQTVHDEFQRIAEGAAMPKRAIQSRLAGSDACANSASTTLIDRRARADRARHEGRRGKRSRHAAARSGSAEGQSELSLTAVIDGVLQSLRIDRTFVDGEGVRWIVDWKTSSHEGGDREAFLDNELARYRGQLERYARVMKVFDPDRPFRVGLYFPLLDAWRELG